MKYVALAAATGFHLIVENDFGGRERRGHDVCLGGAVGEQVDVRPVRMIRDVQQRSRFRLGRLLGALVTENLVEQVECNLATRYYAFSNLIFSQRPMTLSISL